MCNQCEDLRRIHGNQIVWVIMKDRKPQMQFENRHQAERAIDILAEADPNHFWQIVQDSNRSTKWES